MTWPNSTDLITPVTISVDNYFVDREHTPKDAKGEHDYEHIEAIDLKAFNEDLKALDEGRFLDRMVEVLGPGEWMVPTEHGFWWSPWRTRHQVEIVAGADGTQLCRSTFVLVVDVHHDVQALNMANYVNQVSVGGACWYDAQTKELKVTSLTTLAAGMWSAAFVFEQMVQRMVGVMERIAPWLALECEGAVPEPQVKQVYEQVLQIARQQGMPCPTFTEAAAPAGGEVFARSAPSLRAGEVVSGRAVAPVGAVGVLARRWRADLGRSAPVRRRGKPRPLWRRAGTRAAAGHRRWRRPGRAR